jgi:amphiphysin
MYAAVTHDRLNIFYITLEKFQTLASGKYDTTSPVASISEAYDAQSAQSGARDRLESMTINKRIVSTARLLQTQRQNSTLTAGSPSESPSTPSSIGRKQAPPPPPSAFGASQFGGGAPAPPPYTPGNSGASATGNIAAKRRPPPIPAAKPTPAATYVVALYDFVAQVRPQVSDQKETKCCANCMLMFDSDSYA